MLGFVWFIWTFLCKIFNEKFIRVVGVTLARSLSAIARMLYTLSGWRVKSYCIHE